MAAYEDALTGTAAPVGASWAVATVFISSTSSATMVMSAMTGNAFVRIPRSLSTASRDAVGGSVLDIDSPFETSRV